MLADLGSLRQGSATPAGELEGLPQRAIGVLRAVDLPSIKVGSHSALRSEKRSVSLATAQSYGNRSLRIENLRPHTEAPSAHPFAFYAADSTGREFYAEERELNNDEVLREIVRRAKEIPRWLVRCVFR